MVPLTKVALQGPTLKNSTPYPYRSPPPSLEMNFPRTGTSNSFAPEAFRKSLLKVTIGPTGPVGLGGHPSGCTAPPREKEPSS